MQRYEYDEAGRLVKVKTDAGVLLEEYGYGRSRERIKKTKQDGSKVYYAWGGSSALAEYEEGASASVLSWSKSYVYAGSRLLSTITKTGSTETTEYHHPDRLGTKLVTTGTTAKEQSTLPYGTVITSETTAKTNQKFTSYDRSDKTGLDYAVNRIYSSEQGRFTQPDPIGMASVDLTDPQTLNLYTYARNNPVDLTDPTGLITIGILSCVRVCVEYDGKEDCEYQCDWEYISVGPKRDSRPIRPYVPYEEEFGGGGGLGQRGGYPGGDYNKVAQLAPCLKLIVPGFGELQDAPKDLLEKTYGESAAEKYNEFTDYQKAVFVNTVVAAAHVKADFSAAKFKKFYRADYGYENGIYVEGLQGTTSGRHEIGGRWGGFLGLVRKPGASVEFEDNHIDVDLYHNSPSPFKHWGEYFFNKRHKRGTHPGDVEKRLAEEANLKTGVSCKRK